MKKRIYILFALGLLSFSACRKYVEIPPEQAKTLTTATDYTQLLYYTTGIEPGYSLPVFSGDDAGSDETRWQTGLTLPAGNAYIWADRNFGAIEEDTDWQKAYQKIWTLNTVVDGIGASTGPEQEKQTGMAYALVHRAFEYFSLVSMYGRQYTAATAATDPGVPLVLHPKFLTDLTRASVSAVYDQVIADLNAAIPALNDVPDYPSNPSKVSAYAILARVYLHKRDFVQAEKYADLALSIRNTVLDLNVYKSGTTPFPTQVNNSEELLIKRTGSYPGAFPLSTDAENMYNKTADIRYTLLTAPGASLAGTTFTVSRGYNKSKLTNDGGYIGPSVPEIILIKAECQARAGNISGTLLTLNDFRKKRYNNAFVYVNLTAATANEALHLVIDERKRELVARGFRWFDQRRLRQDEGFIGTITRTFKGATYTLEPNSNRYTYAIGDKYIALNPEIIQNPR
ncbi:SusD family protein [Pedobacter westerhofensis]|uniref:SusD family protein n=1 Tax=Pedobacter westerhofensis TaxID=425512 RepID=A0A521AGJ0_9SPHI|nr:RagB/SusD family nutrient uptake outer membrane protein [Pedobacter westerhofensis]SMO33899.1 SusD family protein [Pedobacter westerhofensis]